MREEASERPCRLQHAEHIMLTRWRGRDRSEHVQEQTVLIGACRASHRRQVTVLGAGSSVLRGLCGLQPYMPRVKINHHDQQYYMGNML